MKEKKPKSKSLRRAEEIDEAIRIVYSSLESHLHWTHNKDSDGMAFHRDCVKGYSRVIYLLSKMYE